MKIGIIGSGKIGSTTARLFLAAGHEVTVANSRGPETLTNLVGELGAGALAGTVEAAARSSEVVLVAIPYKAFTDLPADAFAGKTVIDATNYYPQRDGEISELERGEAASSELLARHLAGADVVKAFNTMNFVPLGSEGRPETPRQERLALFLAGDDEEAKAVVAERMTVLRVTTGSPPAWNRCTQRSPTAGRAGRASVAGRSVSASSRVTPRIEIRVRCHTKRRPRGVTRWRSASRCCWERSSSSVSSSPVRVTTSCALGGSERCTHTGPTPAHSHPRTA